jgi:multidrug efflux pump subunit AcrA (membrane-fusion protein)
MKQEDASIVDEFAATPDGSVTASIQARVQGYLTAQTSKEGTAVKKGGLLFQIDPRPFEAALAQTKATLAHAEASQRQAHLPPRRTFISQFLTRLMFRLPQRSLSRSRFMQTIPKRRGVRNSSR